MQVYVVTELMAVHGLIRVVGAYTKERRALAIQESLAREGVNVNVTEVQLNEEQDSGPSNEG